MTIPVFRIRLDPFFFRRSGSGSVHNQTNEILMMFLIRFWRNLTKKDSVESAKYKINKFSNCTFSFTVGPFFMDPDTDFYRIGSGFSADPDPDSGKKVRSGSGKKKLGSVTLHYFPPLIDLETHLEDDSESESSERLVRLPPFLLLSDT